MVVKVSVRNMSGHVERDECTREQRAAGRAPNDQEGVEKPRGRRLPRRTLCGCSANIVGAQISIAGAWAPTEILNYTPEER